MFRFEMLLYAFVIFIYFLYVLKCVYIVIIDFQLIVLVTFSYL